MPQDNRGLGFLPDLLDFGASFNFSGRLFSPDKTRPAPHSGQRTTSPAGAESSISRAAPQEGHGTSFWDMVHHPSRGIRQKNNIDFEQGCRILTLAFEKDYSAPIASLGKFVIPLLFSRLQ
jgi:hypothetical protein